MLTVLIPGKVWGPAFRIPDAFEVLRSSVREEHQGRRTSRMVTNSNIIALHWRGVESRSRLRTSHGGSLFTFTS